MNRYAKLIDGKIMVIWSDNIEDQTMNLYPVEQEGYWDAEHDITTTHNYSDILVTDSNKTVVEQWRI